MSRARNEWADNETLSTLGLGISSTVGDYHSLAALSCVFPSVGALMSREDFLTKRLKERSEEMVRYKDALHKIAKMRRLGNVGYAPDEIKMACTIAEEALKP